MKKNNLLTAIFIVCTSFIFGQPQLPFTGYENNPILEPGSAGTWDAGVAFTPNVLVHEGINYLFYSGAIDPFTQSVAIGYATSNDGFNFTKQTISDPLFEADGTGFDAWSVNDPIVTIVGSTWVLYYGGVASSSEFMPKGLGKATAYDVNGPWTRQENPILEVGNPGEWDSFFIFPNSVISTPTGYILYYWAGDAFPSGVWCIGLATSTDGLNWTKYDDPTTTSPPFAESDPILKPGPSGQWDESAIDACSVLETAHGYEMFYAGNSSNTNGSSIGYATSDNGINWSKDMANNPIYSWFEDPYASNNGYMILEIPTVCKISSTYYMYYDYGPQIGKIGMATAVAFPDTIYVPADRPTIQSAIDFATDGDVIIVEEDTYYENISFLGKAITVASRFLIDGNEDHIDNTIIDGSTASNPDSASVVMFINGEDTTSIICGLTITSGAGIINPAWNSRYGGGIACWESGAKIIHNKIIDNEVSDSQLSSGGAGIGTGVDSGNHWVVIENNEISNNSAFANSDFTFGGGIYICINGIVKNNTVENNLCFNAGTQADGGGIEVEQPPGLSTKVTISNNLINNNDLECHRSEGAGIMIISGEVTIHDNIISNNYNTAEGFSLGAGIMCRYADKKIQISNNSIIGNSGSLGDNVNVGSGICILEAYDVEFIIDANIISNNIAIHGGGFYERRSYNIHFTNNVFSENSADLGGALSMFHPSSDLSSSKNSSKEYHPVFINNTFYGNIANDYAGAIRYEGNANNPIFLNSIFWENDAPESKDIINYNNADLYISYCDINPENITGTFTGENNINVDPQFIDESGHIDEISECIEAGITSIEINEETYHCPDFDIDGQMRPLNGTADIGADEVLITGITKPFSIANNPVSLEIYPNPVSENSTLEFTIPYTGNVSIRLYDNMGKNLQTIINQEFIQGTHQISINFARLNIGVYFCELKSNKGTQTTKLIKMD